MNDGCLSPSRSCTSLRGGGRPETVPLENGWTLAPCSTATSACCRRRRADRAAEQSREVPLVRCQDCGSEVSNYAPACPRCGRPFQVAAAGTPTPEQQAQAWWNAPEPQRMAPPPSPPGTRWCGNCRQNVAPEKNRSNRGCVAVALGALGLVMVVFGVVVIGVVVLLATAAYVVVGLVAELSAAVGAGRCPICKASF